MKQYLLCFLLMGVMAGSCRYFTRDNKLHPDTMKTVMWDMMKIDELYTRMMLKDSTLKNKKENIRLYEEVFALHHITKKQFTETYKFYEAHPIQFKALFDSIDAFANRERNKTGATPVVN